MTKQVMYTYLGTNGSITTPVHIEDTYYIRKIELRPAPGMKLSKDGVSFVYLALVPEEDVPQWKEYPNDYEGQK